MLEQPYSVTVEDLGITIETGNIAKQANGAVTISLDETSVFVAATAARKLRFADQDFFPLSVDYREKFSAAGRFPGGFFKREGRPSEKEILTSRLCDRPLRPLFPKGYLNEVQIIGMLMTTDLVNEPDILMVNAASAAVAVSDIPWDGPIGCVRVGEVDGEFVINPTNEQMFESTLDLIYVGNKEEMMMIEGSADQIPEDRFIEALELAHEQVRKIVAAQEELVRMAGKEKMEVELHKAEPELVDFVRGLVGERMAKGVFQSSRADRDAAVDALKEEAEEALKEKLGEEEYDPAQLNMVFEVLQEELFRGEIMKNGRRVDDRAPEDLRPITCSAGVLPRVHGSSLFARGETQSVVITTLGTTSDTQESDGITGGPSSKSFLLHYNFPPYSVGETGRFFGPGRREIGHGALAERSLLPVLPLEDEFPYTIRVVSEIMESNGSTSMASVCGGCLALMDAGVPITAMVAGISVGLVTEADDDGKITNYKILTDILGSEDHFGDMDFKICGTREGITGFQLDLKIHGLPFDIAKEAIFQNRDARIKILDVMGAELPEPRGELREYAPRIHQMMIDPEKIGALIGPGGKNIRRICEVSGAEINIDDDNSGRVMVYSTSKESLDRAVEEIEASVGDIEVGKIYRGIVRSTKEFGAFVECLPGKEGLVHISELAEFRVERTEDVCKVGDKIPVKCIGIDDRGRVRLSRKAALEDEGAEDPVAGQAAAKSDGGGEERGGSGDRQDRGGRDQGNRDQGNRDQGGGDQGDDRPRKRRRRRRGRRGDEGGGGGDS